MSKYTSLPTLVLCAALAVPISGFAAVDTNRVSFARIVYKSPKPKLIKKGKLNAVKHAYEDVLKQYGNPERLPIQALYDIYRAGDADTVKTAIEQKIISTQHSYDLGDLRTLMVIRSTYDVCRAAQAEKGRKIVIYRSDTGNQSAGARSDMDQTLMVYEVLEEGGLKRATDLDEWATKRVSDAIKKRSGGLDAARFDIATMPGTARILDWRTTGTQADLHPHPDVEGKPYRTKVEYSMLGLKNTPGAYFLSGPIVQEVGLRQEDAIREGIGGDDPEGTRDILSHLKEEVGQFRLLPCMLIGAGAEGKMGCYEVSVEKARQVLFSDLPPKLIKGHGYDIAVNNFFDTFEPDNVKKTLDPTKMPPAAKNLLRAVGKGLAAFREGDGLRLADSYEGVADAGERRTLLRTLIGPEMADVEMPNGRKVLDRWFTVMEVARDLRLQHNTQEGVKQTHLDAAFATLAADLGGDPTRSDWARYLELARQEFATRTREIMIHTMVETSYERVLGWLAWDSNDPAKRHNIDRYIDDPLLREALGLEGSENDTKWKAARAEMHNNYADLAKLQLLYSFRYMPQPIVDMVVGHAEQKGLAPEHVAELKNLAAESKSYLFFGKRALEFPKLHWKILKSSTVRGYDYYSKAAMDHVKQQLGVTDTTTGERATNPYLDAVGMDKYLASIHDFYQRDARNWKGIGRRYVKSTVCDIGNIDGVLQVLRTYSETSGDPSAAALTACRELVFALPIIGQVASVGYTGYHQGMYEAGKQSALMMCCMAVPAAGIVALGVGLTEGGIALYEHEYAKPMSSAVQSAIYKGYVGPSLYRFTKAPAEFTSEDQAALDKVTAQLSSGMAGSELRAQMLIRQKQLHQKKNAWDAYMAEQREHEGGALSGAGGFMEQKKFWLDNGDSIPDQPIWHHGPMLSRVDLIVFHAPGRDGPVDFTVPKITGAQSNRLDSIKRQLATTNLNAIQEIDLMAERDEIEDQARAYARQQRYRDAAERNHELKYQIQLDSLFPYCATPEGNDMVGSRRYVEEWFDIRMTRLREQLNVLFADKNRAPGRESVSGLPAGDTFSDFLKRDREAFDRFTSDGSTSPSRSRADGPIDRDVLIAARDELKFRLTEDIDRSRLNWMIYKKFKDEKEKARKKRIEKEKGSVMSKISLDAAINPPLLVSPATLAIVQGSSKGAGEEPDSLTAGLTMKALGEAAAARHVPFSTPEVRFNLRMVRVSNSVARAAEPVPVIVDDSVALSGSDIVDELRVEMKVTADPTIFVAPYSSKVYQLDHGHAQAAAASGSFKGLLLTTNQVDELERYCEVVGPPQPGATNTSPAFLVFAFCSDFKEPKRVIDETLAYLPQPQPVDVEGSTQYLLGGMVSWMGGADVGIETERRFGEERYYMAWTDVKCKTQLFEQMSKLEPGYFAEWKLYASTNRSDWSGLGKTSIYAAPTSTVMQVEPPDNKSQPYRSGEDEITFRDYSMVSYGTPRDGTKPRPFYFRVGECLIDSHYKRGKEFFSAVTPLGDAEIALMSQPQHPYTNRVVTPNLPAEVGLPVVLAMKDQKFELNWAQFTATEGSWSAYFWNRRTVGDRVMNGHQCPGAPWHPGTYTVKVHGEQDEFSAERDIRLEPADPARQQAGYDAAKRGYDHRISQAKALRQDWDAIGQPIESEIRRIEQEMAGLDAKDYIIKSEWLYKEKAKRIQNENNRTVTESLSYPLAIAFAEANLARAEGRWKDCLEQYRKAYELYVGGSAIAMAAHQAFHANEDWYYGQNFSLLDEDGTYASYYGSQYKRIKEAREKAKKDIPGFYLNKRDGMMPLLRAAAQQLGDFATMDWTHATHVALLREMSALFGGDSGAELTKKADVADGLRLMEMSHPMAWFKGDREKAAEMFIEGRKKFAAALDAQGDLSENSGLRRDWTELQALPVWWPNSGKYTPWLEKDGTDNP